VEAWLHGLLCLDASGHVPRPPPRLPHPSECELYYVDRDTLFSYHRASETFLQNMARPPALLLLRRCCCGFRCCARTPLSSLAPLLAAGTPLRALSLPSMSVLRPSSY
jgi:hypothetical protein